MTTKAKAIIIGVFLVLLAIGGVIASMASAKKVGDPCETYQSSDCSGPGATCLTTKAGNYCSITCKADSECPTSFKCVSVTSETYAVNGGTTTKTASESVKMCTKK